MNRRPLCLALLLATALGSPAAPALTLPDLITQTKPSVVLVGSFGLMDNPRFGFRGTGFAVGDGLTIVTNAHVLPPETPGRIDRQVSVQVWLADGSWQRREARLLGRNVMRDLALLRIEGAPLPPLRLAATPTREGTAIALMGFPLGNALGFSHVTHRGIVASRTQIAAAASSVEALNERTVRQLREGSFEILQLDATAYPGNSGGPVLDADTGEVVGVVNMVLIKSTKESGLGLPSGISYAVPAADVARLLADSPLTPAPP